MTTFLPARLAKLRQYLDSFQPALSATLTLKSSWPEGYCADVAVKNSSGAAIDWQAQVAIGTSEIASAWQGTFALAGNTLSVTRPTWMVLLAPGATTNFGYCAIKPSGLAVPSVTAAPL